MSQSLSKIYIHSVFSTKNRERRLSAAIRPDLHRYMGGILNDIGCVPVEINTEPDHAHLLFLLGRTNTASDVVGQVKKGSTNWLQLQHPDLAEFHWQNGYGAFSVSQSNVPDVRKYIGRQAEHHAHRGFQEEFRALLVRHEIEYDERYVWD
ncbi:MAG: IS200/IS605 family transposase [Pirellulales bacterium]